MQVCENHEWKSIVQETLKGDVFWNNQGHADSIQTLGFMSSHLGFTSLPFCKKKSSPLTEIVSNYIKAKDNIV